ncbi:MAG TPA: efflux RND transporter periplasmic adaptor subunit, partial [Xanthobacteraceae bacterium]
ALIFNQNGAQIAVIDGGTAHIRKVSVARDLGTQLEVDDGVEQGEQVIVNPPVTLAEGSKVQARTRPAARGS